MKYITERIEKIRARAAGMAGRIKRSGIGIAMTATLLGAMAAGGLTSCDVDDDYWSPYPPYGWSSNFWDSRLDGYWQLIEINGYPVRGYDVNYMFFNGSGSGLYYYYLDYRRYTEVTRYWCQPAVGGNSYYQVNIQYHNGGSPSTMNYWFEGGRYLYFQWRDQSGRQTYVYQRYPGSPW